MPLSEPFKTERGEAYKQLGKTQRKLASLSVVYVEAEQEWLHEECADEEPGGEDA